MAAAAGVGVILLVLIPDDDKANKKPHHWGRAWGWCLTSSNSQQFGGRFGRRLLVHFRNIEL